MSFGRFGSAIAMPLGCLPAFSCFFSADYLFSSLPQLSFLIHHNDDETEAMQQRAKRGKKAGLSDCRNCDTRPLLPYFTFI
jgi:hypothetical protein